MNKSLLKEDRVHGTPLYPVSVYEVSCQAGEPLLDLHWHDELEFLMVTQGKALIRVNANEYELKAGEAVFVNAGEMHSGYLTQPEGCSFIAVVFHADILGGGRFDPVQEKYIRPLLRQEHAVPVHITAQTEAERDLLEMLVRVYDLNKNRAPLYELITKGLLQIIVSKLILLGGPAAREPRHPADRLKLERLKTVVEYMQTNYSRPVRLKDLAALVSVNESYFCRFFKELTAKSPIEYMNQVRVQKAAILLKAGNAKVMDVALDVGFHNLSYFIGVFKRYFGCTPSEYRKRER
jgi:AraC-like DNA-binding protein